MLGKLQLLAFFFPPGGWSCVWLEQLDVTPSPSEQGTVGGGAGGTGGTSPPNPFPHLPPYPWSIAEALNAKLGATFVPVPFQPGLGVLSQSIGVS